MEKESNKNRYFTENPNKFDRLRWDWVIGIITNQGVAISRQFYFDDAPTHEELFPLSQDKRWRWDFDKGVNTSIYSDNFEQEDFEIIRNHLRRDYGIRFYENGFHDVEYFTSKMTPRS